MLRARRAVLPALASVLCVALAFGRAPSVRADPPAMHVLFVGNSYTRFHDLPRMVWRVAESTLGGPEVQVASVTHPGWDLSRHWFERHASARITGGGFTHVVLQGHSLTALRSRDEFAGYARLFADEITQAHGRAVLYETWARRRGSIVYRDRLATDPRDMQERITRVYDDVAQAVGADVAPVGRAFLIASELAPRVALLGADGAHPSVAGSYVAACTLLASITREDPRAITWLPHRMSRDDAATLREAAYRATAATH